MRYPLIKFLQLNSQLKTQFYPALCIFGNDEWLKRRAISNVCDAYGVVDDGFSMDTLDAPTVEDITVSCLTQSLFGNKRLVICENFSFGGKKDTAGESQKAKDSKQQLSKLIQSCDGSFCLVFVTTESQPFASVKGLEFVDCNHLDTRSVEQWIVAFGKKNGVAVDVACANKLATYCLNDMARIATETQKLLDYGEISLRSIDLLVHRDVEQNVFNLTKFIANKNASQALELYKQLVTHGEEIMGLFALLYNAFRRMYYVKTTSCTNEQYATYFGVKAGSIFFLKENADKFKPMQLKRAIDCFAKADQSLRSHLNDDEVIPMLIMQLCSL